MIVAAVAAEITAPRATCSAKAPRATALSNAARALGVGDSFNTAADRARSRGMMQVAALAMTPTATDAIRIRATVLCLMPPSYPPTTSNGLAARRMKK